VIAELMRLLLALCAAGGAMLAFLWWTARQARHTARLEVQAGNNAAATQARIDVGAMTEAGIEQGIDKWRGR